LNSHLAVPPAAFATPGEGERRFLFTAFLGFFLFSRLTGFFFPFSFPAWGAHQFTAPAGYSRDLTAAPRLGRRFVAPSQWVAFFFSPRGEDCWTLPVGDNIGVSRSLLRIFSSEYCRPLSPISFNEMVFALSCLMPVLSVNGLSLGWSPDFPLPPPSSLRALLRFPHRIIAPSFFQRKDSVELRFSSSSEECPLVGFFPPEMMHPFPSSMLISRGRSYSLALAFSGAPSSSRAFRLRLPEAIAEPKEGSFSPDFGTPSVKRLFDPTGLALNAFSHSPH